MSSDSNRNPSKQGYKLPVTTRWMVRRDVSSVLGIDCETFPLLYAEDGEDALIQYLRRRNTVGLVMEMEPENASKEDIERFVDHNKVHPTNLGYQESHGWIIGFGLYQFDKQFFYLDKLAVSPAFQRRGVATKFIEKMKGKLTPERRSRFSVLLKENNYGAMSFFKAQGFRMMHRLPNHCPDGSDAFRYQYQLLPNGEVL